MTAQPKPTENVLSSMIHLLTEESDHPVLTLKCTFPLLNILYMWVKVVCQCLNMTQSTAVFFIDMVI